MQTETDEFEKRLRALKPRRPSSFLKARIAAELEDAESSLPSEQGAPPGVRGSGRRVWWGSVITLASATAAVWSALLLFDRHPEPAEELGNSVVAGEERVEPASFDVAARPIERYETLLNAKPSPVYFLDDGTPVQKVAIRILDTEIWEMDGTDGTFTVRNLRDEVRVVPVLSF